jgi:hypothetical protein
MKELSIEEFEKFENEFTERYNEYYNKYDELSKKYADVDDDQFEELIQPLKEQYADVLNIYYRPEYFVITKEYLQHQLDLHGEKEVYKSLLRYMEWIGKEVRVKDCEEIQGILVNIVATLEDYYYVIHIDDMDIRSGVGKDIWETAVSGLELV